MMINVFVIFQLKIVSISKNGQIIEIFLFNFFQGERICSQEQTGSGAEVAKLTPVTKH